MKHALAAAALAALALAGCTQPGTGGPGYGPGPGPGMMAGGWGPGSGPGMMGGYGPGNGPGYGPGYGPGMMGGGYGPGMMGGGYGPGTMGGWAALPQDLTAEQRTRIAQIQRDYAKRQWPLMEQMHDAMWGDGTPGSGAFDEQGARREYDTVAALQKQMFENMVAMRRDVDAVLTPQQREDMRRPYSRR